jgi:hypothetical protein
MKPLKITITLFLSVILSNWSLTQCYNGTTANTYTTGHPANGSCATYGPTTTCGGFSILVGGAANFSNLISGATYVIATDDFCAGCPNDYITVTYQTNFVGTIIASGYSPLTVTLPTANIRINISTSPTACMASVSCASGTPCTGNGARRQIILGRSITTSCGCAIVPPPPSALTNAGTIAANQTVCISGNPANFTSTAVASGGSGGTLEYQWESSTTSITAGFTEIAGATLVTYDPPSVVTQTTWYRRKARRLGGSWEVTTTAVAFTVNVPNTSGMVVGDWLFTGATSNDYEMASNWIIWNSPGFTYPTTPPSSSNNVWIKQNGTCILNQPVMDNTVTTIDQSGSANCRNITIDISGTLTFSNNNSHLHVKGNWNNNGTLIPGTARVKFVNNTMQSISKAGGSAVTELFYEMNVGAASITQLMTNVTVGNALRIIGVIETNGNLFWLNTTAIDGASTGVVDNAYGGHIFGTFRRTIQNNNATYRFPVGVTADLNTGKRFLEYINNGVVGPSHLDCFASYPFKDIGNNVDALLNPAIATEWGQSLVFVHPEAIWTLNPSVALTSGSYGLRLYVQNFATIDGGMDNKFAILKRPTGSSTFAQFDSFDNTTTVPSGSMPGRVWNSGNGYAEKRGFTQFSEFVISSAPVPLSVELKRMQLDCSAQGNRLSWSTSSEYNNDFYTVERSGDGSDYDVWRSIDATGNSSVLSSYDIVDIDPKRGVSYYRLTQTDNDGTNTVLGTLSTEWPCLDAESGLTLYPNPTEGDIQLVLSNSTRDEYLVECYNAIGQLVLAPISGMVQQSGSTLLKLDTQDLSNGIYMVRVKVGEKVFTEKLIRE